VGFVSTPEASRLTEPTLSPGWTSSLPGWSTASLQHVGSEGMRLHGCQQAEFISAQHLYVSPVRTFHVDPFPEVLCAPQLILPWFSCIDEWLLCTGGRNYLFARAVINLQWAPEAAARSLLHQVADGRRA